MFSKLFDSQDLTSHLIFVKSCPTVSLCFYGQNKSKILQNLFHALLNNPINKKQTNPIQNLKKWEIKAVVPFLPRNLKLQSPLVYPSLI